MSVMAHLDRPDAYRLDKYPLLDFLKGHDLKWLGLQKDFRTC